MAKVSCCSVLLGRKKKKQEASKVVDFNKALKTLKIRLEEPVKPFEGDELKTSSFSLSVPFDVQKDSLDVKVMSHDNIVEDEPAEAAYEGEDEHEENGLTKGELSDIDYQAHNANSVSRENLNYPDSFDTKVNDEFMNKDDKNDEKGIAMIQSGHVSDPGTGKPEFWGSPKLKRSCSSLEMSRVLRKAADHLPPPKNQFAGELEELPQILSVPGSPASHCSADRVMLKKHSSSQVLPSRSRKLWWKLFLWSHRNLHKPHTVRPTQHAEITTVNQKAGYTSDTLEPNQATSSSKLQSPGSFTGESFNLGHNNNEDSNQSWNGFHGGVSSLWPQNQWVAFSIESSPFARVDKWVSDLDIQPPPPDKCDANDDGTSDGGIIFPPSPDKSPEKSTAHVNRHPDINLTEETLHADNVIQSLNSSSTVAHISGIGLKALPTISSFSSLRSVNLSNNFIAYITPGSLPKGLHTLNLSRNKINTIEGLRDLTRLRILDLSYNRISRIGQGLSNCTIIKELYLAGNKIGNVEGLHRLLKLAVLDLSFNKLTTTKALGQLVANYNSLQALNLLGNPIQSNLNDDQLRKAIIGLLPKLAYLNKQPINPQKAGEVVTDSVAKAALGTSSSWNGRRKAAKRVSSSGSSSSMHKTSASSKHKSKSSSKKQTFRSKTMPSAHASTSY